MNRQRGMTMIELMVSLAIVMVVIGAATTAYLKLLRTYRTQGKLAESYLANLTGLEMLRYDIETAGFGLPVGLAAGATYSEANDSTVQYYNPANLNDSPNNAPRAIAHLNNSGANNSDILTIKSSAANLFNDPTSKKWSMILAAGSNPFYPANPTVKLWGITVLDPVMDFTINDNFIVLDNNGILQPAAGQWSCYTFNTALPNGGYYANASSLPYPTSNKNVYYIYGLDNSTNNPAGAHRMPFNRVDYYLDKILGPPSQFPNSCAASTFTLYRSTINQVDGTLNKAPLIDCVRDFQVAFGLATNLDGNVNSWVQTLAGMSAAQIQQQVREVRVFLLYQEGLGDTAKLPGQGFSNSGSSDFRFSGTLNLGDQDTGNLSSFNPATGPNYNAKDSQYRWKVLEMDIKPMNLNSN